MTFSAIETLQIAVLIPVIFLSIYLFIFSKTREKYLIAAFYFLVLSANIFLESGINSPAVKNLASYIAAALPELSFLLIISLLQNIINRVFYTILAVPVIGVTSVLYLKLNFESSCFIDDLCISSDNLYVFYRLVTACFVFMLLVVLFSKIAAKQKLAEIAKEKYWLITVLIVFNLIYLSSYLLLLFSVDFNENVKVFRAGSALIFIYLIFTSIFRVFSDEKPVIIEKEKAFKPSEFDKKILEEIDRIIFREKSYHQARFTRKYLANKLSVSERTLSKLLNWKYGKTFPELVNELRIDEAKNLLKSSKKSIAQISESLGFSRITSFNRVFKDRVGKPASEFRKEK